MPAASKTNHVLWCLIGLGIGLAWTALGCGLALIAGVLRPFFREWLALQGFFLVWLGTWLILTIRSGSFPFRLAALTGEPTRRGRIIKSRILRAVVVLLIGIIGTATVIGMGFNAHGAILLFFWLTCGGVCFAAGIVTLHVLEVLIAIHRLEGQEIKVFRYAPARTPELRMIVSYFTSFTLLVSVGYAFGFLATLYGHWTSLSVYVEGVRMFWPVLYVPICSVALTYPHFVVHRLIQREKERTLLLCQEDIDVLLSKYSTLKTEEIERTNTLAQLFDRMEATPNYVIDFGIAARTLLPLVLNLATLFAKVAPGARLRIKF